MAVDQKDVLFLLIKSLSKSEKRQFKLYTLVDWEEMRMLILWLCLLSWIKWMVTMNN